MSDYLVNPFTTPVVDSRLLHEPITKDMLSHEPYTPESADSHSPNPEKIDEETRRSSVSPIQLKNRLENIIRTSGSPKVMKRSVSQNVAVCAPKIDFRCRAMSETVSKIARARLISSGSVTSTRLQSHHSSSDEDWFQFDENSNSKENCCLKREESIVQMCDNDVIKDSSNNSHVNSAVARTHKCCCVVS